MVYLETFKLSSARGEGVLKVKMNLYLGFLPDTGLEK